MAVSVGVSVRVAVGIGGLVGKTTDVSVGSGGKIGEGVMSAARDGSEKEISGEWGVAFPLWWLNLRHRAGMRVF